MLIRVAIGTVLLLLLLIGGASLYMTNYALTPIKTITDKNNLTDKYISDNYPLCKEWLDSLNTHNALRDTFIVNKKGVRLHAYYVPYAHHTKKTAVIVHGYTDNALRMMMIGHLYSHDLGYNILLPDLQYHGKSGGKAVQMGWKDRLDVEQWMQVANNIYGGDTHMVVHGISMGAATTMMVSGDKQPRYVKAFVEDCGYTSVWDQFAKQMKEDFHLPPFPILYTASALCQMKYGWGFKEASALKQVAHCKLPMLFIHGDQDDYVPTGMVYPLYEAKPKPKELWIVPGAGHALSYKVNPQEYRERVKNFLAPYIQ
nr:alpha/beta hydrolase [Porphyromonas pogonae]